MSPRLLDRLLGRSSRRRRPGITWITPALGVGPAIEIDGYPSLRSQGVDVVVDVRAEAPDQRIGTIDGEIERYWVPVVDHGVPTAEQLQRTVGWVVDRLSNGDRVYVHCREGIGRSPLLIAAILVAMGYSPADALSLIRRLHLRTGLNAAQLEALRAFHAELKPRQ